MSKFVKTEVKTTILESIDDYGVDWSYISITPLTNVSGVNIVVGARYSNRSACGFSKRGLKELISILQEVYDAMEQGE